jgi:hypothetical protein
VGAVHLYTERTEKDTYKACYSKATQKMSSVAASLSSGAAAQRQPNVGQIWRRNNLGVRKVFIIVKKNDERMVLLDINDGTTRVFFFRNGREFKSYYTFVDKGVRIGDEWSINNWVTYFTILTVPVDEETALANGLLGRVHDSDNEDESPVKTYYVQVQNYRDDSIEYFELLPLAFDILERDRQYRVRIGDGEVIRRLLLSLPRRLMESSDSDSSDSDSSDSDNEPAGRDGSASSSSGTSLASAPAPPKRGEPEEGDIWFNNNDEYSRTYLVGEYRYRGVLYAYITSTHEDNGEKIVNYKFITDMDLLRSDSLTRSRRSENFLGDGWGYHGQGPRVGYRATPRLNPTLDGGIVTGYGIGSFDRLFIHLGDDLNTRYFASAFDYTPLEENRKRDVPVPPSSNAKKRKRGTSSSSSEAKKRATKEAQDMGKCPICYEDMGIVEEVEGKKTNYFQLEKDGGVRIGDKEVKVLVCCNAAIHYKCFLGLIENGLDKCPLCKRSMNGGVRDPLEVKIVGCRQITQIVYKCRHLKF